MFCAKNMKIIQLKVKSGSYLDYSKNSRSNIKFFEFVKSDYFDIFSQQLSEIALLRNENTLFKNC